MSLPPLVSVVMPAYNHAPFVVESIRSVLEQDFENFEFLIGDDGSKDNTPDAIRTISDPRIVFHDYGINRGAVAVHNELFSKACGKYIAVINSDDAWLPGKLSAQVAFLEDHPDIAACFGRAIFIDRIGAEISKDSLSFGEVFDQQNRSRGAWLRRFFENGNCLCHPTILIRREAYLSVGEYDDRFIQMPDFEIWIRLIKKYDINVLDRDMIRFRILPGENASALTRANVVRAMNEHYFIARKFFDGIDANLLVEGFSDLLVNPDLKSDVHIEIEKTLMLLTSSAPDLATMYKLVAINKLYDFLAIPPFRKILREDYRIDLRSFNQYTAMAAILRPDETAVTQPGPTILSGQVPLEDELGKFPGRRLALEVARRVMARLGIPFRLTD